MAATLQACLSKTALSPRQNHLRCKRLVSTKPPKRLSGTQYLTEFVATVRDLIDEEQHLTASAHEFELAMWDSANFRKLERRLLDRENVKRTWALITKIPPEVRLPLVSNLMDLMDAVHFNTMVHDLRRFAALKI